MGAQPLAGARAVAEQFAVWRMGVAQLALVDGVPSVVWAHEGRPRVVVGFTIADGKIIGIEQVADPERVSRMRIELLAKRRAAGR